jgi:hypothetical protein
VRAKKWPEKIRDAMSIVSYDAVLTVREFSFNKKRPRNEKATLTHQSKRRTKFTRIDGFRLVFIETESTLLIDTLGGK